METMKRNYNLSDKTIKKILEFRARGKSYSAIAGIFKIRSREMVRLIINASKTKPQFKKLNEEVEKSWAYLNRELNL